jgi:hypothetical protein
MPNRFCRQLQTGVSQHFCAGGGSGGVFGVRDFGRPLERAMNLTASDRRSENVGIETVVVPELKLRDIQRQILAADFVKATNDPALEDAPKPFNRICVDSADYVLADAVIDNAMRVSGAETFIDIVGIRAEQAHFVRNCFANKLFDFYLIDTEHNAGDNITLTLYSADNWRLEGIVAASSRTAFLVPMSVLILSADVGFINLDYASKLFLRLHHSRADFMAHEMSGVVRAEAQLPLNLKRADTLFAGGHQMNDLEPVAEGLVGIFEDGPGNKRKPIAVRGALLALPMPLAGRQVINGGVATTGADDALRPAASLQIGFGGFIIAKGEYGLELSLGHLVDRLGLFSVGHGGSPSTVGGYCHA